MRSITSILASPRVYAMWQWPFARAKLRPLLARGELSGARRVLDVGCGPGTNAPYFAQADYIGMDLSPEYIAYSKRRYGRDFRVQDVRQFVPAPGETFDFVFANSLLHHLNDDETRDVLSRLANAIDAQGHVHIIDLVLPDEKSIARFLALHDRGKFARPIERWRQMFTEAFQPEVFEPYSLRLLGIELWRLVYFKGVRKT